MQHGNTLARCEIRSTAQLAFSAALANICKQDLANADPDAECVSHSIVM
jgi:hypothetical protein